MVGVVNTATFYAGYLMLHPHLPYFAAFTLAFLVSMVGSFFMNTYFTYRTRPTWRKFLLFPLPNITNYLVQSGGVLALVEWLKVNEKIAPLLAAVVAIPITFVLSKLVLTSRDSAPGDKSDRSTSAEDLGPAPVRVEVVDK
ncbi:GtrA family protein [Kitasatospora sp. MAP5-34]|uniref:GtrA family protein n=1 Tax=Kitasatospora sp. MAP5-34 TaxID=3035102 RepID=UPI0024764EEB|nr:GtrA family protein [Kitasatospora sp. MAP5-34]